MDSHLAAIANQAAGFYFLTYDNSQISSVATTSNLRLCFINVPNGPVNSLVYISKGDKTGFKEIFGDISRRDERKGNYSIRTVCWMLENGPVLVCNLRAFDDELDLAGMSGLSTTFRDSNNPVQYVPYSQLYNTERLWWSDPSQLLKQSTASWWNVANVGSSDMSVFMRKSTLKGYDVTLKSWYTSLDRELPLYVNGSDYVSETMIDVYIFKTDFSDNQVNMTNENYGYLFDENGLKSTVDVNGTTTDSLSLLMYIDDAQYVSSYSGSLIPGMVDMSGNSLQIQLSVNGVTSSTGLLSVFDESAAEDLGDYEPSTNSDGSVYYENDNAKMPYAIDMVGHSLYHIDENGDLTTLPSVANNMLSFSKPLVSGSCTIDIANSDVTVTDVYDADHISMSAWIPSTTTATDSVYQFYYLDAVTIGKYDRVVGADSNLKRVNSRSSVDGLTKTIIDGYMSADLPLMPNGELYPTNTDGEYVYPLVPYMNAESTLAVAIYTDYSSIEFRGVGTDLRSTDSTGETLLTVGETDMVYLFKVDDPTIYVDGDYLTYTGDDFTGELPTDIGGMESVTIISNSVYAIVGIITYNGIDYIATAMDTTSVLYAGNTVVQYDSDGAPLNQCTGLAYTPTITDEQMAELKADYGTVYNFMLAEVEDKIYMDKFATTVANEDNQITITFDDGTTMDLIQVTIHKANPVYDTFHYLTPISLPSYKYRADQFTNGTNTRQSEILDIMNYSNIIKGLKNSQDLKPRYIIDAFKTYIEPSYKYQFGALAKELNENSTVFVRSLINEAFIEDMSASINPYFRASASSSLSTDYIETGGNAKIASTNTYEKSTEGDKYCFYFGPGLKVNHYGQEIIAPPAGVVSKVFLDKYSYYQPYTIVANKTGILTGDGVTGIELDFDQEDRGPLERVGYNAIIKEVGTGLMVFGNNTGQYRIKTSLSKIHISELLAYMQEQMLAIMKDYIFQINDYQNRLEIKNRADTVMNAILDNGGVLYFQNVCDGTNNTVEIIENSMGILDTTIVPAYGMEKMVHRTYLESAGNITGFEIV